MVWLLSQARLGLKPAMVTVEYCLRLCLGAFYLLS